jgi:hypothetical protein
MRIVLRIAAILLLAALIIGVYMFRFSREPLHYKSADGKVIFGYDQWQDKWLFNEYQEHSLGIDGPHVFYKDGEPATVITTKPAKDGLMRQTRPVDIGDTLSCLIDGLPMKPIRFCLREPMIKPCVYTQMPSRLLALSDIEGNIEAFYKLLLGNGVVDSNYNWTFGDGHMVLVGDFMDRGINVLPVLYLIYKLEAEAEAAGGAVHYILGNHEQINLKGIAAYARPKYRELVRQMNIPYRELYATNTLLGRWLRTKNCIEQIGGYLFVHAGISKEVAELGLKPETMNDMCRRYIDVDDDELSNTQAKMLLGREGILWYRGMVSENMRVKTLSQKDVVRIADQFGAKAIVVGHTVVDDVSIDHGGRLIRLDIHHTTDKPEALLIEGGRLMAVDTAGKARTL